MHLRSVFIVALVGASSAATAQILTPDGYGRIQFGERLDSVERASASAPHRAPPIQPARSCVSSAIRA